MTERQERYTGKWISDNLYVDVDLKIRFRFTKGDYPNQLTYSILEGLWMSSSGEDYGDEIKESGLIPLEISDNWYKDKNKIIDYILNSDKTKFNTNIPRPGITWVEAREKVKELGEEWRFPSNTEFENILQPNKDKIPYLKESRFDFYWTSSKAYDYLDAFYYSFFDKKGGQKRKNKKCRVIAVRDINATKQNYLNTTIIENLEVLNVIDDLI